MRSIGFIGVGIMGKSMVRNLMKAGFDLHIYARNKTKVEDFIKEGAAFHESIAECVTGRDAVITIVGFPEDVEEVYFEKGNIIDSADPGTYLIDMTTTSPKLSQRIASAGSARGFHVLDAPVTGGDSGARDATLSILVGGEEDDFNACLPLFQAMGTNINRFGGAGAGQHCKLANQIMIAGSLSGVVEAFAYAEKQGLDLSLVMKALSTGAAGSKQLDTFGPKIIADDYAPGFYLKHLVKDLRLAKEEGSEAGLDLEMLGTVLGEYEQLQQQGLGDLGTQGLMKRFRS